MYHRIISHNVKWALFVKSWQKHPPPYSCTCKKYVLCKIQSENTETHAVARASHAVASLWLNIPLEVVPGL